MSFDSPGNALDYVFLVAPFRGLGGLQEGYIIDNRQALTDDDLESISDLSIR